MNVHIIIDFMHIYYKYFFQVRDGKLKHLSAEIDGKEVDTTMVYYPLRDVENIRAQMENFGHDVTVSVCFDMKSVRNKSGVNGAEQYKSGRKEVLTNVDFDNLNTIYELLKKAGHNVYRFEGCEADDIVNHLSRNYSSKFDYTIIYTNDKDLFVNINDKVGVMRFKQYKGYTQVDKNNYEQYLEEEFGVYIPYNAIGLYLSSVGDSADKIKGITKFGKVAFRKLITKVKEKYKPDFSICGDYDKLKEVIEYCHDFLTDEQYQQLIDSFALVSNVSIDDKEVAEPVNKSTVEKRTEAYERFNMNSLI